MDATMDKKVRQSRTDSSAESQDVDLPVIQMLLVDRTEQGKGHEYADYSSTHYQREDKDRSNVVKTVLLVFSNKTFHCAQNVEHHEGRKKCKKQDSWYEIQSEVVHFALLGRKLKDQITLKYFIILV